MNQRVTALNSLQLSNFTNTNKKMLKEKYNLTDRNTYFLHFEPVYLLFWF